MPFNLKIFYSIFLNLSIFYSEFAGTGQINQSVGSSKKNSSRRNAWGNLSYADLITQAISSASDKRLTLSQIYEWMVQNVPYFKDKGDSNSSAGWKVRNVQPVLIYFYFLRINFLKIS